MELFLPIKPTILIVDDSPTNLMLLTSLMQKAYTVKAVSHGEQALQVVSDELPDLILLDITMPDMDGYEICHRLKANPLTNPVPIVFLTSRTDLESERRGMELGAVDYITRPITPSSLLSRVKAHVVEAANAKTMRVNNNYLEGEVEKRKKQMLALQDVALLALASLAETRDVETGNHLKRTQHYMRALGHRLQSHPRFSDFLTAGMVDILFKCAPLHDIGKVGIPDHILLKPGRYEPEEFEIMKMHPSLGHDALVNAQNAADDHSEFLEIAKQIVYSHHEKWDGTGYPQGLLRDAIPIPARLMALADVYDALISRRVYKAEMTHEQAVQVIVEGRGRHFDPDVVEAFLDLSSTFQSIAICFKDGH
ncbi:MAG: HD domain-containing phosphohydrolase [Pseudomonadota bacterium]